MNQSDIETSIDLGHGFLLHAQHAEGWWADFLLSPGRSDAWVTAYVGRVVAIADDPPARAAAGRAWQWLARRSSAGWGYNGLTPEDADTTAWAIRFAEAVGAGASERASAGRSFLASQSRPDGGLSTYGDDAAIRAFIGAPATLRFDGWCGSHPCVTAAAAAGLGGSSALCYLRTVQADDGHWPSYWWCEPEYATAMAASALGRFGERDDHGRVARAATWAARRLAPRGHAVSSVCPDGSAFATALALRTLQAGGDASFDAESATARRAVDWLLCQQQSDGSWPSSAGLRVPPPDQTEPDRHVGWQLGGKIEGGISLDQERLFTTATVVETLRAAVSAASRDDSAWNRP